MATTLENIPKEYQRIVSEIPENEKQSFFHSLSIVETEKHPYLRLLEAIDRTIMVYSEPSPYWIFMYSRISFIGAQYDELFEFWNIQKHHGRPEIAPFVGRVLAFQNKFEEAISICMTALDEFDTYDDLTLIDVLVVFELNFTLGLAYAYTRQFEKGSEVIARLEKLSSKYYIKRLVTEEYFLDLVFIEHIITGYVSFFKGQPKEMTDALQAISSTLDRLKDPWLKGFYYNIYGISKLMFQELEAGEEALRNAFTAFESVHDLRGYSTVGANLGQSLITKGKRKEAREYIESVIGPMVKMKSYWIAVGNMLQVVKTYVEEKNIEDAVNMLEWAENIAKEGNVVEPNIYSMFSRFYCRVGNLEKSKFYLEELEEITKKTIENKQDGQEYVKLFNHNAAAAYSMAVGDLSRADLEIRQSIELADKTGYFNFALEASIIQMEILLKRYLVDRQQKHLFSAIDILKDLTPLLEMTQNPYYETLFLVLGAYIMLALDNDQEAEEYFDKASELATDFEGSEQHQELLLYKQRWDFLNGRSFISDPSMINDIAKIWFSEEFLPIFYVNEAMRLLANLQFEQTNLGQSNEPEKIPNLLFIIGPGGITIFSKKFREAEGFDEVLVGGFLSALTTFSQELFGGGMLTRIDQENHVLLMEKIGDIIIVLIVEEETYLIRKKFKKFSSELTRVNVLDYLQVDMVISEYDMNYQIIDNLVDTIFMTNSEHDKN